jgi:hypothetical protein
MSIEDIKTENLKKLLEGLDLLDGQEREKLALVVDALAFASAKKQAMEKK